MAHPSTVARIPKLAAGRYLAFEDGDSVQVVQLADGAVTVGRRTGAGVFLDDATVSRRHWARCGRIMFLLSSSIAKR